MGMKIRESAKTGASNDRHTFCFPLPVSAHAGFRT
jgi:hypothetical protein